MKLTVVNAVLLVIGVIAFIAGLSWLEFSPDVLTQPQDVVWYAEIIGVWVVMIGVAAVFIILVRKGKL
jgi:hypothetical protein